MPAPYVPLALANCFIRRAGPVGLTHMKLQKLVYCAHGWWLAYNPNTLFVTERPEVWQHGPVFPSLYSRLSGFGGTEIYQMQSAGPFGGIPVVDDADHASHSFLDFVWGRYGAYTAFELSDMTHRPGTPWYQMSERHNFKVPRHLEIPDDLVIAEFQRLAREGGLMR